MVPARWPGGWFLIVKALFVRVFGQWRFEGFMEEDLFLRTGGIIKDAVEKENGKGAFFYVELPARLSLPKICEIPACGCAGEVHP